MVIEQPLAENVSMSTTIQEEQVVASLQQQEVHPTKNIQHGLDLWERVRKYDKRSAAEDFTLVLSRALSMASNVGRITPMSYCRGVSLPTHILYADDVLIFCTGTKSNIRRLLNIFNQYSEVSGQIINNSKSRFFTGAMSSSRVQMISSLLGFNVGALPFTYLGCPIFCGKPKCPIFE